MKKIQKYDMPIYRLQEEDGVLLKIPDGAKYLSVEVYMYTTISDNAWREGSFNVWNALPRLWMEIDPSKTTIKRRFKTLKDGELVGDALDFIGLFSIPDKCYDRGTYLLYEYNKDPLDKVQGWKETPNCFSDHYQWTFHHGYFSLDIIHQRSFKEYTGWDLILSDIANRKDFHIFEYEEDVEILKLAANYLIKNYNTRNKIIDLIENKNFPTEEIFKKE